MELKIVYDNSAIFNFIPSHGFACILTLLGDYLLFDTGWSGPILLKNLKLHKINPAKIKYVFLSHFHWDHIGGLPDLLLYVKPLVFMPKSFSINFKTEIIEISQKTEILPGVFTTGELSNKNIVEQSLIIKSKDNVIAVSGCAHPGVDKILSKAAEIGKVNYLVGGFHDFSKLELLKGIGNIMPCHCTKNREEILRRYPKNSSRIAAGTSITI